jgi:hypothetical protein
MQHAVNFNSTQLAQVTRGPPFHENTLELIGITRAICLAVADMGLAIGGLLLGRGSGHLLAIQLLLMLLLLGQAWLLNCLLLLGSNPLLLTLLWLLLLMESAD